MQASDMSSRVSIWRIRLASRQQCMHLQVSKRALATAVLEALARPLDAPPTLEAVADAVAVAYRQTHVQSNKEVKLMRQLPDVCKSSCTAARFKQMR